MANIKETIGENTGAGYNDEKIDEGTGVAGVRPAYHGYNSDDGSYVAKGNLSKKHKVDIIPADTGDELYDSIIAMHNDAQAYALTDQHKRLADANVYNQVAVPFREGGDDYMYNEYGSSNLDTGVSSLTSEQAKSHRDDTESIFRPLGNGLIRGGIKTATSMMLTPVVLFDNIIELFGGDVDKSYANNLLKFQDDLIEDVNRELPTYDSQEKEDALSAHPLSFTALTSGNNVANLLDNAGYTIGAGLSMGLIGNAGAAATAAIAGLQAATAAKKAIWNEDAKDNAWWQNITPIVAAAAAGAATSMLPKGLQNGVKVLSASTISASGEAEMETQMAVKEYIEEKSGAIDANISARKAAIIADYKKKSDEILQKMEMAVPSEKERLSAELEQLNVDMENNLAVIDWQRTKAVNEAVKDADSVASITRLANYGILTISNAVQFGKLLAGGYKTVMTEADAVLKKEAKQYVDKELKDAGYKTWLGRELAKFRKNVDYFQALDAYSRATGHKVFDESTRLGRNELIATFLRNPIAEGSEELEQSMASNAGKAYAERNTDDYYGQISGIDAFRRTESAWQAAAAAAGKTLGSEQAWSEFLAGALMGAVGVPGLRSFRKYRATGEKNEDGSVVEEKGWQSPIYFRGGIYGEVKKAKFDRENRGQMAQQLNQLLTPDGRTDWQRRAANIAAHMQYQADKGNIAGLSEKKDKFHYENAEDAEYLKTIELFQQTGQMGLLRQFVQSELDYDTVEELRDLQNRTTTIDSQGNKVGRYSEFDLSDPGQNISSQRQDALNEEVQKMRNKISEDVQNRLDVIDLYEKARMDLKLETDMGLSAEQTNCLAWYKVRLELFDKRTKSMFYEYEEFLNVLNDRMSEFTEETRMGYDTEIAMLADATDEQSVAKKARLESAKQMLDLAEAEWNDRWDRAQKVKDDMTKAKILFTGNKEGDPIGDAPVKKPWWMSNKQWAKRVTGEQSDAAKRRAALMGVSLANYGVEGRVMPGLLDVIIDDLDSDNPSSQVLSDAFSGSDDRKDFAAALFDMRECQAAIVRFKDLYQYYKDNPSAMVRRAQEQEDAVERAATVDAISKIKEALTKDVDSVEKMYNAIIELIKQGTDEMLIDRALRVLVNENNAIAKQLLDNQKYVRVFMAAVDLINTEAEDGSDGTSKLAQAVLKELAIEAASKCKSVADMHSHIKTKLASITKDADSFVKFLQDSGILDPKLDTAKLISEVKQQTAQILLNNNGQFVRELEGLNGQSLTEDRIQIISQLMPQMLDVVDDIIRDYLWRQQNYAFGKHTDIATDNSIAAKVARAMRHKADNAKIGILNKLGRIGQKEWDDEDLQKYLDESGGSFHDSMDVQGEQAPETSLDGETALSNTETVTAATERLVNDEPKEKDSPSHWIPSLSFFSVAFKKMGKTIRNKFVKLNKDGSENTVNDPNESSFKDFWDMLESLGVFEFVDNPTNKIKKGEQVYFVVDKMNPQTGRSNLFGLEHVDYNGVPYVFMCLKRKDANGVEHFQPVGCMNTSKKKLEENGQLSAWQAIVTGASQSSEPWYTHNATGTVAGVHQGLVEVQDGAKNNLSRVFGEVNDVELAVKVDNETIVSNKEHSIAQIYKPETMKTGHLYALVHDNGINKFIPMPCQIAQFDANVETTLGKSQAFTKAKAQVKALASAAVAKDAAAFDAAYNALGKILAMAGYGLHIDLKESNGKVEIVISKVEYSSSKPIPLRDNNTNEILYQVDKKGKQVLDNEGNPKPLYRRKFAHIIVANEAQALAELMAAIQSDEYSVPFRIDIKELEKNKPSDVFRNLILDGVITTDIVEGNAQNGLHTRGCYVQVDFGEKRAEPQETEHQQSGTAKSKKFGNVTIRVDSKGDYYVNDTKQTGAAEIETLNLILESDDIYSREDELRDFVNNTLDGLKMEVVVARKSNGSFVSVYFTEKGMMASETIGLSSTREGDLFDDIINYLSIGLQFERAGIGTVKFKGDAYSWAEDNLNQLMTMVSSEDGRAKIISLYDLRGYLSEIRKSVLMSESLRPEWLSFIDILLEMYDNAHEDAQSDEETDVQTNEEADTQDEEASSDSPRNVKIIQGEGMTVTYIENAENKVDDVDVTTPTGRRKSVVRQEDVKQPKMDIPKELAALREICPWLSREEAVVIVDHLIETGKKGRVAQGEFINGLIILSSQGVRGTAFHEAFHSIFATALDDKTRDALIQDAKNVFGAKRNAEAEEFLADAFRDYMVDQVYEKTWTRRIKDFFRWLFNLTDSRFEHLTPTILSVFSQAQNGEFKNAGKESFNPYSLRDLRIAEYRRMGYDESQIIFLENARSSFSSRTPEVRRMINEAGITEEAFDMLSENSRDELVACL